MNRLRALLLVDHGSRRPEANRILPAMAARLTRASEAPLVRYAHLSLAPPGIGEAFDACVAAGASEVVVHPYFLAPGRHSRTDIPAAVREASARHPGVSTGISEPLGLHDKILEVILERVEESSFQRRSP
jgi:sirohydrochlorin ferrochelatase